MLSEELLLLVKAIAQYNNAAELYPLATRIHRSRLAQGFLLESWCLASVDLAQ
jgi:hypothetical protein